MCTTIKLGLFYGFVSLVVLPIVFGAGPPGLAMAQTAGRELEQRGEISASSLEEEELLLRLTQQFNEAQELFNDPQRQSQSIDFFGPIIDRIEEERRRRDIVAEGLVELQQQSLEFRARSYFNAGQLRGAADDFRQLILDNPRFALDAEALSPKIVDFFEDQKKQLVGYVAVNTEPAGARVSVNGDFIGITNFFPVEVHTGMARIEITLAGYESYVSDDTQILPGEITPIDVILVRNSAKVPIITQPTAVEVVVDGELFGVTSGNLPPDLRSFMPAEVDPARVSAPFELSALPLGRHQIQLRLDCYETIEFTFNAEEARDYTAQIVRLPDSVGSLNINSNPSDARVFLNGEYKGNTPLDLPRVCSGEHHLEVKHATGKYVEDILVGRDEALSFECPIRPTLAFLGLTAEAGVSSRDMEDIEEKVVGELRKLEVMNLVLPKPAELKAHLGPEGIEAFVSGGASQTLPDRVQELSEKLGSALEVEAILVGYVPAQRLTKDVVFNLLAVGSPRPDRYPLNYLDREAMPAFLEVLSTPTPLYRSWIGLKTVDTRLVEGPIVLSVYPDGPSAQAGVSPGDVILQAEGSVVTRTVDLLRKVQTKLPDDNLAFRLSRQGAEVEVQIEVGTTPVEVPLNEESFLYNKAIVDLRHRLVVEPETAPLARLNLGLCHMQLGDFETALKEHLPQISLSETRGISQGTVYYYTALAYLKLGERAEAARIFQQALEFPEATVQSNDGPKVVPLVQRRLRELGQ